MKSKKVFIIPSICAFIFLILSVYVYSTNSVQAEFVSQNLNTTTVWLDDFEDFSVGTTLSQPWVLSGKGDAVITNAMSASGNKSVRLVGTSNACWGTIAYRPIGLNSSSTSSSFTMEFYVSNGNEVLSGCHSYYGGVEVSTCDSWTCEERGLIRFSESGEIRGGVFEFDQGDGIYLGNYDANSWYKIRIGYEMVDASNVKLFFWINDIYSGEYDFTAHSYEEQLSYVGLWVGEGSAWFDDVVLFDGIVPPQSNISTYLPYISK